MLQSKGKNDNVRFIYDTHVFERWASGSCTCKDRSRGRCVFFLSVRSVSKLYHSRTHLRTSMRIQQQYHHPKRHWCQEWDVYVVFQWLGRFEMREPLWRTDKRNRRRKNNLMSQKSIFNKMSKVECRRRKVSNNDSFRQIECSLSIQIRTVLVIKRSR